MGLIALYKILWLIDIKLKHILNYPNNRRGRNSRTIENLTKQRTFFKRGYTLAIANYNPLPSTISEVK